MSSTTQPRRVRSPRGGGAALGEEIVTAALARVDVAGVSGLTLRGVARDVGVSAPAIYAHFADIDAIVMAVAEHAFADLADRLGAAAAATDPGARLRAVSEAYLGYARERPGRYLVMFGGQWDATAALQRGAVEQQHVDALGADVMAVFVGALGVDPDADVLAGPVPSRSSVDALTVWLLLHGYAHQQLVSRALTWPTGMTDHVLDCVETVSRTP